MGEDDNLFDEDELDKIKAQIGKKAEESEPHPEPTQPAPEPTQQPQPEPAPQHVEPAVEEPIKPRVIHFEINADEPLRAKRFYESVFGWKVDKWDGPVNYWIISTGDKREGGVDGGILKRSNPRLGTQNVIEVPSIDECLRRIEGAGGKIVMPKRSQPGIGYLAYCEDSEGNVFGIKETDLTAQ